MIRFYISDLHYDHANILTFKDDAGNFIRPFKSLDEMQATISHNWNKTVGTTDTIYVLGDLTMGQSAKALSFLETLRGRKILIRGNHDQAKLAAYSKYFADVRAYDIKPGIICSHIPIHPASLARFGTNVHGHLHANEVGDPRYLNVCCEKVNYTPVCYEEILLRIEDRKHTKEGQ